MGGDLQILPLHLPTSTPSSLLLSLSSPTYTLPPPTLGATVRLGHKRLRTLMKSSSLWYLPGHWVVVGVGRVIGGERVDGLVINNSLSNPSYPSLSLTYPHPTVAPL